MIRFTARRHEPASLSHWGQFECLGEVATVEAIDMGLVQGQYVSVFEFDGKCLVSHLPQNPKNPITEADRMAHDDNVLFEAGLCPWTIEFIDR